MLDVAVPQTGVGVFHAWLFRGGADGWVSKVFVSTDARRPYPRGVIRSTVGAYPRGTGSNPVEGNGHSPPPPPIPSALSFVFLWHTPTHTLLMMAHKAETAVQGWNVDPREDVILTHTGSSSEVDCTAFRVPGNRKELLSFCGCLLSWLLHKPVQWSCPACTHKQGAEH